MLIIQSCLNFKFSKVLNTYVLKAFECTMFYYEHAAVKPIL